MKAKSNAQNRMLFKEAATMKKLLVAKLHASAHNKKPIVVEYDAEAFNKKRK